MENGKWEMGDVQHIYYKSASADFTAVISLATSKPDDRHPRAWRAPSGGRLHPEYRESRLRAGRYGVGSACVAARLLPHRDDEFSRRRIFHSIPATSHEPDPRL